jgi:hypothetical protein
MRVWIQSLGSSNIRMCEFRLEFLSYIKKKKKKKKRVNEVLWMYISNSPKISTLN